MLFKEDEARDDKIRRCLRSEEGKFLIARLEERKASEVRNLCMTGELLQVGRYQGRIEIIDWLLKLREE